jgi:hypothetical protein
MTMTTADEWFASLDEYTLSKHCPTCGAGPGHPCNRKNGPGSHTTRTTLGLRHRNRDVAKAPWPEDRVPGTNYSTIKTPHQQQP